MDDFFTIWNGSEELSPMRFRTKDGAMDYANETYGADDGIYVKKESSGECFDLEGNRLKS